MGEGGVCPHLPVVKHSNSAVVPATTVCGVGMATNSVSMKAVKPGSEQ